jgi:membrane associated rhomboid family serine protease
MYVSFAPMLLEIMGARSFAGLYIVGALSGSAAFFLWSCVPGRRPDDGRPTNGASGESRCDRNA